MSSRQGTRMVSNCSPKYPAALVSRSAITGSAAGRVSGLNRERSWLENRSPTRQMVSPTRSRTSARSAPPLRRMMAAWLRASPNSRPSRFSSRPKSKQASSSRCWVRMRAACRAASSGLRSARVALKASTAGSVRTACGGIGARSRSPSKVRQRLRATYTWPKAKAASASIMARSKVSPWLLWMVIAQAGRSGYWLKLPTTLRVISVVSGSTV